ncbi:MAG: DUF5131 family protein [Candidatus Ventricola sp.]
MKKTKIDWADSTWNPVTGCLHGCEYCYARTIANRFGGCTRLDLPPDRSWRNKANAEVAGDLMGDYMCHSNGGLHVLDKPARKVDVFPPPESELPSRSAPYPYYFDPTFHRYRLEEPTAWTKPRTIFVCSMSDLFGDWVPDEWIREVFHACEAAPWHRYMFLTKNPGRYLNLAEAGKLPIKANFWYGSSTTTKAEGFFWYTDVNTFVSIEPILEPFTHLMDYDADAVKRTDWIIVGAETGNRKEKAIPYKSWVIELKDAAEKCGVPIFMKESLRSIMGSDFRQEFPWEVR